ncbi:MAG: hypothetical protein ACOY4H_03125 [Thermodesulfobacteriota bacterium]
MHLLRTFLLLLLVLLPAALHAGTTGKLTVFYTNDIHGETEPCG